MGDDQTGKPIPKIVGRGKNRLKRSFTEHGYDLRSTTTRCHSSHNTPCSFCYHYQARHAEMSDYNLQLRKQLFRTTTKALVIDRLKRQRDQKVTKLRGILQDRAAEIREKDMKMQDYIRDARLRKDELQVTVTQLDRSKEEIADLNTQLEQERKRFKTLQEVNTLEKQEFVTVKSRLRQIITQISQLLHDLKLLKQSDSPADSQTISSQMEAMQEKVSQFDLQIAEQNITDEAEVSSSRALIYKIISDVLCGVCHEMFIDPVALPCGHTFCEFCIRMWFKRTRSCPVCRQKMVSCGQLHAVYQFRMIVELLENFRTPEEQNCRSEERVRRDGLRDELYRDPVPRRFRERPTSTSDRGERFSHRRRRIDGNTPVPYPIPLPEASLPTARLDMLPPPQPFQMSPLNLSPEISEAPGVNGSSFDTIREPSRNVMTLLLNETFTSIDRFIRGSPNIFPMTRPLINMIESAPTDQPSASQSMSGTQVSIYERSSEGFIQNSEPLNDQTAFLDVGGPLNPIVVADQSSTDEQDEIPSHTPQESPPAELEDFQYQSIISESSDEIWPNNTWQPVEESITQQGTERPNQVVIDLRNFEENMSIEEVILREDSQAELEPLLEGDLLSIESESEFSESETESETESESEPEEGELAATESLDDVD